MGSVDASNKISKLTTDVNNNLSNQAILAIDIGTTNLKCCLYDENLKVIHSTSSKLEILRPLDGFSEIDPKYLLEMIISDIKKCIMNRGKYRINCFGISTQRNSVILWNKVTWENYSNIILWNDRRSADICDSMNKGLFLNILTSGAQIAALVGPSISGHRIKSFSKYKLTTGNVATKLKSQFNMLENKLKPEEFSNVLHGTIETWLLWNLTKEKIYATDITCASATGIYDMYLKQWSTLMLGVLSIPIKQLPEVYDTCHRFGHVKEEIFNLGYDIPITAVIADSQSSVIAECGFEKGDCVITIGTGSFISVNTGCKPLSSNNGFFPFSSYKYQENEIFILHAPISSAGIAIEWAKSIGLFKDYDQLNEILESTENSGGVFFISPFGYMDKPNSEDTGFVGIKATTTKAQMLRAVIDSIVFTIKTSFDSLMKDLKSHGIPLKSIKLSGGVAKSDFVCQYLAYLFQEKVERSLTSSSTSLYGAAFLAGIGSKIWTKVEDLVKFRENVTTFRSKSETNLNLFNRADFSNWKSIFKKYE